MYELVTSIVPNIQIHTNEIISPLYTNYYVRILLFHGKKYTDSYKRECNFIYSNQIGMCEFVLCIVKNIQIRANEIV